MSNRTLTCAAPNPHSHRSGGNARSLSSWFSASIRQSTRARWAPASPCKSGGGRPHPTKHPSLEGRPREPLAPARPSSCRGWHAICRAAPVEPDPQRRRRPPSRPRPTGPACGGKFHDTSVPAVRAGGTRRAPPLLSPKWCGSPSLPWWPPSCATSWPSGGYGGWPSSPLPRSELHKGASIAPRRRTDGTLQGLPSRGSRRPNAFAVSSTDGARRSKWARKVQWLSRVRPRYFMLVPTSISALSNLRR